MVFYAVTPFEKITCPKVHQNKYCKFKKLLKIIIFRMVHMPDPPVEEVKHAAEEEGVMEVRNLRQGQTLNIFVSYNTFLYLFRNKCFSLN